MNEELELGASNAGEIEDLRKALSVGYAHGTTDQTGFGATRMESLETTLKMMVEKEKTSKFWTSLKKAKADSTVEEFSTVNNIGSANFYVEGGLPEEFDEDIRREFELVKYVGAVGKVPNVAQTVKSIANNMALVQQLKTTAIIRALDIKSFFANSNFVPTEFNGFLAQFNARVKDASQNVIDLRGKVISPDILSQVGSIIEGNYGDPMNLKGWTSVEAFRNYAMSLIANKTYMVDNNQVRDITSVPKTFTLGNGGGALETDLHLKYKGQTHLDDAHPKMNSGKTVFAATSAKAPAALIEATCTAAVAALVGSQLAANTYDYAIVPVNAYGAGAAFEIPNVVVAADKKVVFTIADNASTYPATAFEIYRKVSSGTGKTDYRYLKTVAVADTKEDTGSEIPETEYSFFFDWDFDQVLTFKQLLPLVKMPLATIDDSVRWLQKLYGTPILFNPNKMVVLKNVGKLSW